MIEHTFWDARGETSPRPLEDLTRLLGISEVGDTVRILVDDTDSPDQISAWVEKNGHEIVSSEEIYDAWCITVRKLK